MIERRQRLALQAAVYPKNDAEMAWRELREISTIEDLDHSVTRVLPSIYRNIGTSLQGNDLLKLKGAVRHTWARNTEFFEQLKPLIAELNRRAINYRVLKGGAINLLFPPANFRIMGDIDLLISRKDLSKTQEALRVAGFKPKYSYSCPHGESSHLEAELNFVSSKNLEIDLHIAEARKDSPLFKRMLNSSPLLREYGGVVIAIPQIEHILLHSILHGNLGVEHEDQAQTLLDVNLLLPEVESSTLMKETVAIDATQLFNQFIDLRVELLGESFLIKKIAGDSQRHLSSLLPFIYGITYPVVAICHAIKFRTPRWRDLPKIWRSSRKHRGLYLLWLYTGLIRQIEERVTNRYSGFIDSSGQEITPISAAAKWSNDWRFVIHLPARSERLSLTLSSEALKEQSFLVFSNGRLVGVTERNLLGIFTLVLREPSSRNEISIRLPFSGCKKCAQALGDLKVSLER